MAYISGPLSAGCCTAETFLAGQDVQTPCKRKPSVLRFGGHVSTILYAFDSRIHASKGVHTFEICEWTATCTTDLGCCHITNKLHNLDTYFCVELIWVCNAPTTFQTNPTPVEPPLWILFFLPIRKVNFFSRMKIVCKAADSGISVTLHTIAQMYYFAHGSCIQTTIFFISVSLTFAK